MSDNLQLSVVERLEIENERLKQENQRLKRLLAPPKLQFPIEWGLKPQGETILNVLMDSLYVSQDRIKLVLEGFRQHVGYNYDTMVPVHICRLNKQLAWLGITIHARRFIGYHITRVAKEMLLTHLKEGWGPNDRTRHAGVSDSLSRSL